MSDDQLDSHLTTTLEQLIQSTPLSFECTDFVAPYIIAEAGVNHEGSIETAKRLIYEAADAGADAIKFQTYRAESIASKHSPAYWDTEKEPTDSQYKLFKKYDKFWKAEFEELKKCCEESNIEFLSTPFDKESAQFLNDLMEVFKISSSDLTNKPFIQFLCAYGKPVILSTGASNIDEIDRALAWIDAGGVPVALLHCVLNYPTANIDANLGMIRSLRTTYPDRLIGYSDHTLPRDMQILETAWLLGAQIIEKHFTHDKTLPGNDHYHAMDSKDLALFKKKISGVVESIGEERKRSLECEAPARLNARRSLVALKAIRKGTPILSEMLTWKRPAHGISPGDIDRVINRKATCDIAEDELLTWSKLK